MTSPNDKHLPALAPGPPGLAQLNLSTRLAPGPRKISVACLPCKQAKRKVSYCSAGRVPGIQPPSQATDKGMEGSMTTKGPSPEIQVWNQDQVADFCSFCSAVDVRPRVKHVEIQMQKLIVFSI